MGILVKYTLKSIKEKKFRTFLIIFSITLSVALTFASLALKDSITNTFSEMIKKYLGTANLMITATEDSPSSTLRVKDLGALDGLVDYQIGSIETAGLYRAMGSDKQVKVSIRGYETEDLDKLGIVKLTQDLDEPFVGKVIYLSDQFAKKQGWDLGDTIDLTINETKHKVRIVGLGKAEGALSQEKDMAFAVMPTKALQKIFNLQDRVSFILIKTADDVDVELVQTELASVYRRYKVDEPIPWDDISKQLNNIIIPFFFMLLLVLATSVFIIYTAFKVIIAEKMPVLGTFRSIGATKATTDFILLMESLIYGILGAISGIFLGRLILSAMGNMMAQGMLGSGEAAQTEAALVYYIVSGGFGVVLSLLSAIIPIVQVSKIPVRDIVLGTIQQAKEFRYSTALVAFILLMGSVLLPQYLSGPMALPISGVSVIVLCIALVMMTPQLTNLLVNIMEGIVGLIFGNLGALAVKNIRGNKSVIDNIALLTLGIAGILLINTISASVTVEVLQVYNRAHHDVSFYTEPINRQTMQTVLGIKGVDAIYPTYSVNGVEIKGTGHKIGSIDGVDGMDFFNYWDHEIVSDPQVITDTLGKMRAIILSTNLRDKLGVKLGDKLSLKFSEQITRDYQVIGFVNTLMNNGNYAIASGQYLKSDMQLMGYSELLIKTEYPDQIKIALEKRFKHQWHYVSTMAEDIQSNEESNRVIMTLLQGFSGIAMLIGIFGILNNFVVSLLGRRRSIAVMKSVGMSRAQTVRMLLIEALISGLIGGMLAIGAGLLLISQIGIILKLIELPISLHLYWDIFISGLFAGGGISLVANLLPAFKASKMGIVQAIKFE